MTHKSEPSQRVNRTSFFFFFFFFVRISFLSVSRLLQRTEHPMAPPTPDQTGDVTPQLESQKSLPTPFLTKTYQLVDDVISLNDDGSSFVVWDPTVFARDILPKHFKHNNFSSFVRQLNTYNRLSVSRFLWRTEHPMAPPTPDQIGGGTPQLESQKSLPTPFLTKTYQLVDDSTIDDVISWNGDGSSFVVWDTTVFARDILPKHFKHNNFSSFVRQLNTYKQNSKSPIRF
ncbi:Heat stress transcription factor B-2a [Linum grandiflorum]